MPGQEKIPPLTVVHVASRNLSEDEIRDGLSKVMGDRNDRDPSNPATVEIRRRVDEITADDSHPYDKLQSIVRHLRSEFTFDRGHETQSDDPIHEFLQTRRGGDHLFATTAALMAREMGLQSRLVTGFYVRPGAFDLGAGHASVLPGDVHVWTEVKLGDDGWFEIEPSPGYRQPKYEPSLWLLGRQFATAYWPMLAGLVAVAAVGYLGRRVWIDWLLSLIWSLSRWLRPRRKFSLGMRIIEARAKLAGNRRPPGRPQRMWMEDLTRGDTAIRHAACQFCDSADALFFNAADGKIDDSATRLVRMLRTQTIFELSRKTEK